MQRPVRAGMRLARFLGGGAASPDGFCPREGGVLELSGVFGGRPSLASSSATRAVRISTCRVSAAIVSACARTRRIRLSLSCDSSDSRFIKSLNHANRRLSKSPAAPSADRP